MEIFIKTRTAACCILISFIGGGGIAQATALGEKVPEVSAQQVKSQTNSNLKISQKVSSLGVSYSVQETEQEGQLMKEFVNSDGVVFAVSWKGLGPPDFSDILGKYYKDFQAQSQSNSLLQAHSRNRMNIKTTDIVVRNSAHGSSMRGLAYVPALLPAGVAVEELK